MSNQGQLFSSESSGIELMYMWFGQIVDESTWVDNNAKEKGGHTLRTRDDFQGYGYRYKVRIFGRNIPDKSSTESVTDDQLVMAEVAVPTTAGSGHGGSVQTPNMRQGTYVFGFYKDGIDATEPIIFGVLPNHAQTRLFGQDPDVGFVPRTGYVGVKGTKPVSTKNILGEGPDAGNPISESVTGNYVLDIRDIGKRDEQRKHFLPKTYDCDSRGSGSLSAISKIIKDIQSFLNKIKSATSGFFAAATDILQGLNSIISDAALLITNIMKGIIDKMRGFVVNILNKALKTVQSVLPPNLTSPTNEAHEFLTDIIACIFNKLIKTLFQQVLSLLTSFLNKSISAPLCAVENFIGNLLSGILGPITSALSSISSVVSGIASAADAIFNALGTLLGLLQFLTCDEQLDCNAGDGWSFWYGESSPIPTSINFSGALKNITKNIANAGKGTGGSCNTGPVASGPPKVTFFGGGGIGAIGNAIVSPSGKVIGVDIINGGNGYISSPTVFVEDEGGNGSGSVLYARLESDTSFYGGTGGNTSRPEKIISADNVNQNGLGLENILPTVPTDLKIDSDGELLKVSDLQINIGGSGGYPVTIFNTSSSLGGTKLTYFNNAITVGGIILSINGDGKQVNTNLGLLRASGTGGIPVRVGGNGGTNLYYSDPNDQSTDKLPIKVNVDVPLFKGIEKIRILGGPFDGFFNGQGTFENGSFRGTGTLTGLDSSNNPFTLEGNFSGYDSSLVGSGTGVFTGSGKVINGRYTGDGTFTVDKKNTYNNINNSVTENANGVIKTTFQDNTVLSINPDGTGTITTNNGQTYSVVAVKSGSTGGSPVLVGNTSLESNGNVVSSGGRGGQILQISFERGKDIYPVTANGAALTVNGFPVVVGSEKGIPLVIGTGFDSTPVSLEGIELNSNNNTIKSSISVGGVSDGISVPGFFAGPDGSSVQEVVVIDTGTGYLPYPDGSMGGSGVKLSNPNGTIIFSPNVGYSVYPPGINVNVLEGDLAYLPPQSEAQVYSAQGELIQSLIGEGQQNPILIEGTGILTTPIYNYEEKVLGSPTSNGAYPALLQISDVLIGNSGVNYLPEDTITISPNNGAKLTPKYDRYGRLISVNIDSPGFGFEDYPDIFISSKTGINAYIIPIFGVERVGKDLSEIRDFIPRNVKLIEVIDCVGKIKRGN